MTERPTQRSIVLFWAPLAATWVMMGVEGPFLAAVIARLPDPKFNLAAYGVAYAFAILVEAPVIMLMSASTALVEDSEAYRKLRNFANALNLGATTLLLMLLVPPVFGAVMETVIGLPADVADLLYGALLLLLPWPAAIGWRRFLHGILIRKGRTRLVALGTVLRLTGMATTAVALFLLTGWPGAWVGGAALSAGVITEAAVTHLVAGPSRAEVKATPPGGPDQGGAALDYGEIARFYWPLALTSLIGLTVQPMLTFFMGRARLPIESLAVFPVVQALSFLFRSLGLSYQEAAIALLGPRCEHADVVRSFGLRLGLASSAGLALVAFTPLAHFWFMTVSGLTPELVAVALVPTMILVPLPGLSVLLSYQRAVLVQGRRTGHVTTATAVEVASVAALFALLGWGVGWVGVTAAFAAFLGGRIGGNLYLLKPVSRAMGRMRAAPGEAPSGGTRPARGAGA